MALTSAQQTIKDLTTALSKAPRPLQEVIMGKGYTPDSKQLVTLDKIKAKLTKLDLTDLQNIVAPILLDKIFKTEFTTFESNNPYSVFYRDTQEFGKTKEHILTLSGTMVNLVGETKGNFGNVEMSAGFNQKDANPSVKDYFESHDVVYYTKHIRAFVMVASITFTELKGAFDSQSAWDSFTSRKTQMLIEQAKEEEAAEISAKLSGMLLPQNIGVLADDVNHNDVTRPKITLLGDDYEQAEFVQALQTYVNNIKFPKRVISENPLGLPLVTKPENLISFVTPDILSAQNFLEAYAYTANKVTLPVQSEMFAPLPEVQVTDMPVQTLGTVADVTADGKYTGTVLPIAFIGDNQILDVVHSETYSDTETNTLREFFTAQYHDHFHVHPSFEKNVRFFCVPIDTKGTLVAPATIATTNATTPTAEDGKATIPTTLKDGKGADVTVTAVIKDSTGAVKADPNKLKAGDYTVTFSATNYHDVTKAFTIGHA